MSQPTYAVQLFIRGFAYSQAAWPTKHAGRPTNENLTKYVQGFEESCETGCNKHLGSQHVMRAYVKRQSTGEIVASYGTIEL